MSISTSIYIPRMSIDYTEELIVRYMRVNRIGNVSYVDFTPINKKPGFGENVHELVKSAFVHFSNPWLCSDENYQFECKTFMGNTDFWKTIATGQPYKLQISPYEYWLCLKNKNPIQRSMMNIHQVVENGRHLEGLVEAQAKTIQEQANKLQELERKLQGTSNVVYQLLGGLFHQQDQFGIMSLYLDDLFCRENDNTDYHNTSKWGILPTTRQGDDCEKKISDLEEKVKILNNEQDDYERKIYDEYIRLGRESEKMECEMNEYENNDEMRENLKTRIAIIQQEKCIIRKMYENKTGLPWSYLLNKISFRR